MFGSNSKVWGLGLFVALAVLSSGLFRDFTEPWNTNIDFNGAWWSQSAHNHLRAGLLATAGVPSASYFGPLPIPPSSYYTHHPPLLSIALAGLFAMLGEKEWVARLLPIASSLVGLTLLWILVEECAGSRAAAFSAVLFAAMPMELVFGRMVNFEPIDLVWMLSALLCLRRWEQTGKRLWRNLMIAASVFALWTAWLGYMFVLVVCLHFIITPGKRNLRLALLLLGLSLISILLFLLHIRWVQPDAWQDLMGAFNRRLARTNSTGITITWAAWAGKMANTLRSQILPFSWALGILGTVCVIRRRKDDESLRYLGSVALCFFVLSAFYVIVFQNASYVHDYASFYFTVPLGMMGGVALEAFLRACEARGAGMRTAGLAATMAMCAVLIFAGERQALALYAPYRILGKPNDFTPQLGHFMREKFPEGTNLICNFLPPYYGPYMQYYAQRTILEHIFTTDDWINAVKDPEIAPVGAVIWLGKPDAKKVLAALPAGSREEINVQGCLFCFWKPHR